MNIETRLKTLEQTLNPRQGMLVMIVLDSGQTPEQTEAIRAAKAEGRPIVLLSERDAGIL